MSWLIGDIKDKLRPWVRSNPALFDRFSMATDAQFLDIVNLVGRDINTRAELHIERYNKDGTDGETNYEMQGNILHVYYFKYVHTDWKDQRYSWVNDTIVLLTAPDDDDTEMDIHYLRDTEDAATDTDELDLPVYAQFDFLELVKIKILTDFGDLSLDVYEQALETRVRLLRRKQGNIPLDAIRTTGRWLGDDLDDSQYDITDRGYVSRDSVAALGDGDYEIV